MIDDTMCGQHCPVDCPECGEADGVATLEKALEAGNCLYPSRSLLKLALVPILRGCVYNWLRADGGDPNAVNEAGPLSTYEVGQNDATALVVYFDGDDNCTYVVCFTWADQSVTVSA